MPKLVDSQGFGEDVGYLKVCADVLQVSITSLNALSDDVIIQFNMLFACVEHREIILLPRETMNPELDRLSAF